MTDKITLEQEIAAMTGADSVSFCKNNGQYKPDKLEMISALKDKIYGKLFLPFKVSLFNGSYMLLYDLSKFDMDYGFNLIGDGDTSFVFIDFYGTEADLKYVSRTADEIKACIYSFVEQSGGKIIKDHHMVMI